mmetsp:Transcript_188/g.244  ORF Transcript_188/g.244 Transcript_188/m.244 type:complete len:114 (-) Transcript_188:256-597(-)
MDSHGIFGGILEVPKLDSYDVDNGGPHGGCQTPWMDVGGATVGKEADQKGGDQLCRQRKLERCQRGNPLLPDQANHQRQHDRQDGSNPSQPSHFRRCRVVGHQGIQDFYRDQL